MPVNPIVANNQQNAYNAHPNKQMFNKIFTAVLAAAILVSIGFIIYINTTPNPRDQFTVSFDMISACSCVISILFIAAVSK